MAADPACYHCGLPNPVGRALDAIVDGRAQAVCCPGCQAVAEAIAGSGLSSYYRTRTAYGHRPDADSAERAGKFGIYDLPEVQAAFVRTPGGNERETTLILEGITCAACLWLNEQHLASLPGVSIADINYATRRARVRWDSSRIKLSQILSQVAAIGYHAWPATSANAELVRKRESRAALWRLFVAGFGMMQVMMYAVPSYLAQDGTMSGDLRLLMRLASLALTVPVVLYSAAPFFHGAWRDARRRRLGMDVPVALGVAAAFGASIYSTFTGGADVYYDSIAMFVFFLLSARYLEMRARQRAAASLEYLDKALPLSAHRLRDPDRGLDTDEVPAMSLKPRDQVLVRAGESFPADGRLVSGDTECDEALLTGESGPVRRRVGDGVIGGAFNRLSPVVMIVEHVGEDTCASGIRRLVESASMRRPDIGGLADRYAGVLVAVILLVAAISALVWMRIDPSRALWVAVAVLVVSCPCAVSLATPTVMTVAVGMLSRRGVVVVRGHAVEALASVTHVVFDKTGTLTEGRLGIASVSPRSGFDPDDALGLAAALERMSEHPIAKALIDAAPAGNLTTATDVRNVPGAGLEGGIDGARHRLGTQSFVAEIAGATGDAELPANAATRVWLGRDGAWIASIDLVDSLRPETAAVVQQLRAAGKRVLIWSGDGSRAVGAVAARLGVDHHAAGLLPQNKLARMVALQREGAVVAMVGDGVNDAPVLAQAQVSIAMGGGALLSQATADVVLVSGRLQGLSDAFGIAARARRILRQNLGWAAIYNLIALPLAGVGLVTPWLAGIGMGASSLLVVLNALRLDRSRNERRPTARAGTSAAATGPGFGFPASPPAGP
ncbi:MAG TPA: heavy metal translocating P-type ATPase [Casimicrobiaceae bacterium]|nr:heavy metal translocating P-type ATPase [Casimicrobiaceae bacterium]